MSTRVYCTECKTSEPFRGRAASILVEDLPRGWVLRQMVDQVREHPPHGLIVIVLRVTSWVLCPKCALDITPVIHPEVHKVLIAEGFDP